MFSVGQRPKPGPVHLFLKSLEHTHTRARAVGLLWTSDQLVAEAQHTRNSCPQWISNLRSHQSSDCRSHALDRTAIGIGHTFMFTSFTMTQSEMSCGEVTYFT
jgi:hypothetical protein